MWDTRVLRASLVVAMILTPTVIVAGPVYGFDIPKLIVMAVTTTAMVVLAAPSVPPLWKRSPGEVRALLAVTAGFVAWMVLSTVLSDTPRLSVMGPDGRFIGTAAMVLPAALLIVAPIAADTLPRLDRGTRLFTLVLGAIATYAVIQFLGLDPMPWAVEFGQRPVATFGNSNFVGAALCVTLPFAFWMWLRSPRWRAVAALVLVVSLIALWASQARLGWIAAAAGAVVFWALLLRVPVPLSRWKPAAVAILPVGSVAVGLVAVGGGVVIGDATGIARLNYWRAAVPMWLENPVTGVGIGRFAAFHREYRPPESVIEVGRDITVDSSHAWILDLAATTGTPGALLWVGVLVAAGLVLRRVWLSADPVRVLLTATLAAALTAHGVQSSISVPTVVPVWIGWLLVGAVAALGALPADAAPSGRKGGAQRRRSGAQSGRGPAAAASGTPSVRELLVLSAAAVTAITAMVVVQPVWRSSHDLGGAISARSVHGPEAARPLLEAATARTGWWPEPWTNLAGVGLQLDDPGVTMSALEGAKDADPRRRETVLFAIEATARFEGAAAARPWIERLRELDPNGLDAHLTVATWALQVGDHELAEEALAVAALTVDEGLEHWARYQQLRAGLDGAG